MFINGGKTMTKETAKSELFIALDKTARELADRCDGDNCASSDMSFILRQIAKLVTSENVTSGDIHNSLGAPGDYGYESRIGNALYNLYRIKSEAR
jgi:hypothetical protein